MRIGVTERHADKLVFDWVLGLDFAARLVGAPRYTHLPTPPGLEPRSAIAGLMLDYIRWKLVTGHDQTHATIGIHNRYCLIIIYWRTSLALRGHALLADGTRAAAIGDCWLFHCGGHGTWPIARPTHRSRCEQIPTRPLLYLWHLVTRSCACRYRVQCRRAR